MWYKQAIRGRIYPKYEYLGQKLLDFVESCKYKSGKIFNLNFEKLNENLPEELKKYILKFEMLTDENDLGVYIPDRKILKLPNIFDVYTIESIIHEFVHAIHTNDLEKLKYHGSGSFLNIKYEDLKNNYEDFQKERKLDYIERWINSNNKISAEYSILKTFYKNKSREELLNKLAEKYQEKGLFSFTNMRKISKEQWEAAQKFYTNVTEGTNLYLATNEELLAYLESAVRFFSVNNMMKVYEKYYQDKPDEFLKFVKTAITTIGFVEKNNKKYFKGLSMNMQDLIKRITYSTGLDLSDYMFKIVNAKWWQQLSSHISDNYLEVEKIIKSQTQSSQSF